MVLPEFDIKIPPGDIRSDIQAKIDSKTKPIGALGKLEDLALQIGLIQQTTTPQLNQPHIVVFAGDHGIAKEGVSAYPQEVTAQMVRNFLNEGAAINVFSRQHGIGLTVVDSGVNSDFKDIESSTGFISMKIGMGTKNIVNKPAMTSHECIKAIHSGAELVSNLHTEGTNIIGLGEMGIGNTSSASMITSVLLQKDLKQCTGTGTGLTLEELKTKVEVLRKALQTHKFDKKNPVEVLQIFGGFEIAMMVGAFLDAAQSKMIIMVDGFIASAAFLVAANLYPDIIHYAVFTHLSTEQGHKYILDHFKAEALLNLDLRLGEGSGCAVAYPLIQSAVQFLNNMASFEKAKISERSR